MKWTRCSDDCVLPAADPEAYPLSQSTRPDSAWVSSETVVRSIAAGGHEPDHPFAAPTVPPGREERADLLRTVMVKRPAHVLEITAVCDCSFLSPFLDGRPLQDFGLGSAGRRLTHPQQRRISWPPRVLERLLADLAAGLQGLHEIGIAHGDPALMNAYTIESDDGYQGLWVDLNSIRSATPEDRALDIAAFEQSCLWPTLADAEFVSPSLVADLANAAREASDPVAAYAAALVAPRSDHVADTSRAILVAALGDVDTGGRDDLVGRVRRRITATMAPLYFLDQTRSDQIARFFMATLEAERTRHRLAEEERTRLHHHRFSGEIAELRAWSEQQREAVAYHENRAEAAEQRAADLESRAATAEAERSAAADRARQAADRLAEVEEEIAASASVRDSLANAEARAATFRAEADAVRSELNEIYESRGWHALGRLWAVKRRIVRILSAPARMFRRDPSQQPPQVVEALAAPEAPRVVTPEATDYPVLVSVIMPVYNKGRALLDAIDSVHAQTLSGVEIVVWDDGSTDPETRDAVDEAAALPGVSVFRAANRGVVHARNSAMRFARGEFISCLDPDDRINPTYLEKAVVVLRGDPEVAIAYPWQRTLGDKDEVWRTQDLDSALIGTVNHVPVCAVFRREVFLQTGGFSEDMAAGYEDWELWAHAAELGFRGRVIPEALFEYHFSGSAEQSRDATARDRHLELATRIGTLHPLLAADRVAELTTHSPVRPPSLAALREPRLPAGSGRPIVLTLPWFTLGGADRMVETLTRHWSGQGRTVVVFTTLTLGEGMPNRVDELMAITPYVYQLESLLPRELWREFVSRTLGGLPQATIVNVGSTWLQDSAAELRARHSGLRIIDHHFNDVGHLEGNRRAARSVDTTVVAYEGLTDAFLADGRRPELVVTVPVGIDPPDAVSDAEVAALRSELGLGDRVAAFIGRFSEEKNPDWIPRLAAALAADDITVVAVGDGPLAATLEAAMESTPNLVWRRRTGLVERVLAAADVLMVPSRVEGIPLVLMEALALGTPVVATAVGGIPEVEAPGLRLVAPGDFDAFAQAVRGVIAADEIAALPESYHATAMLKRYDELVDAS